ncbi:CHAT domain-containing protein [Streptomyces scopuliridis]|uniref:CHAT domain-containing protein n=1 Tax=Streptomyces scopuliridis TaxID=452529 RepID=UPI00367B4883
MRDDIGWTEVERLAGRLVDRLDSFWNSGNQHAVMDPAALAEADELRATVLRVQEGTAGQEEGTTGPEGTLYILDLSILQGIALLHYARCLVLGPETEAAVPDARMALGLFALVGRFAPDEVPEQLRETVAALDVPAAHDLQTMALDALELYGRWQTTGDPGALEGAISLWRGARNVLPASHPGHPMLLSNLCGALRARYTVHGIDPDLEEAADAGRRAVRLAPADDPDRAMYLANLSGALSLRYAVHQARTDLDDAVDTGVESVRVAREPHALFHSNAGLALLARYERDAAPEDLEAAADALRLAVRRATPDDPQRAMYLSNLGLALDQRFIRLGDPADLDAAVDAATRAVAVCPPGTPGRPGFLANLSGVLRSKAERSGAAVDLNAAVDAARQALATAPATGPSRTALLGALGLALRLRFRSLDDPRDIDESVDLLRQAARDRGDDPRSPSGKSLHDLGRALLTRFGHTGDPADVDGAIEAARRSAEAAGSDQGVPLSLLGEALGARSQRTGTAADTEEAIAALRKARTLLAGSHPAARSKCLSELGLALARRFDRTSSLADLDEAIGAFRKAIEVDPDDQDRTIDESHIGAVLMQRFSLTADPDDLAEAVRWNRRAAQRTAADGRHTSQVLFNLGRTLQTAYERSGDLTLLDEAVRHFEEAERATRSSDPQRAKQLSNLGAVLRVRAERLGSGADLDRSVELSRQAVAVLPEDHPERAIYLSNLSVILGTRYLRSGMQQDLEDSVRAGRESVGATSPADASAHVVHLTNLGVALRRRYEWSGALADLDESIETSRAAVRALPTGHVDGALHLNNLSVALTSRHERTGMLADLDEAIEASRAAVRALPDDHPQRAMQLSNLALALRRRYESAGRRSDGDEAVTCLRQAAHLCPEDHPQRPTYLANLAMSLLTRYAKDDSPDEAADVDEAAQAARTAVGVLPDDHPQRAMCLSNLGSALLSRCSLSGDPRDLAAGFDALRRASGIATAPAAVRFRAARGWATASAGVEDWAEALDAHRAAIAQLPLLAWHGLDRTDRLDALGRAAGLAGDAAAVALNAGRPRDALRLLEQGRGVLLAQALDARDDMTVLREQAPELARRIREVRALLDSADSAPDLAASAADPARLVHDQRVMAERRRELAREMDDLVRRARELPGLADFLRPPSLERLRAAAENGPVVVVNTSALRCDALVVTRDALRTVTLPDLALEGPGGLAERAGALLDALASVGRSPADAWRAQRILLRTLGWLWDVVAGPVLAALGSAHSAPGPERRPTRLWWCPTGLLSLLPLHAAGHYGPEAAGADGPPRSVPDRYVCSYTTTLRALAAQTVPRDRTDTRVSGDGSRDTGPGGDNERMLAVDQSDTPGLPPLPQARAEVRLLADRVPRTTVLSGPQASRAAVLDTLRSHSFLHFSGHGSQDPTDSAGGALYCHDHRQAGPLTVADISRLRLDRARLAFLSACETARGAAGLPDEAVHLAGALQLAGFTHVVAAQWVVDDACALRAAELFYTGLMPPSPPDGPAGLDPNRAANALHTAVQRLRERDDDPLSWAAYIHAGP